MKCFILLSQKVYCCMITLNFLQLFNLKPQIVLCYTISMYEFKCILRQRIIGKRHGYVIGTLIYEMNKCRLKITSIFRSNRNNLNTVIMFSQQRSTQLIHPGSSGNFPIFQSALKGFRPLTSFFPQKSYSLLVIKMRVMQLTPVIRQIRHVQKQIGSKGFRVIGLSGCVSLLDHPGGPRHVAELGTIGRRQTVSVPIVFFVCRRLQHVGFQRHET